MSIHRRFGALAIATGLSMVAGWPAVAIADPAQVEPHSAVTPHAGSFVGAEPDATAPAPAPDNEWTSIDDLPQGVQDTAAAWLNGRSYVLGGYSATELHATAAGQVYDTASGQWSAIADLPTAVMQARAAVVDGTVYVFGGWTDTDTVATVHAYDPETDSWTHKSPMPQARAAAGIAVVDGKINLIGGCASTDPSVCTPDASAFSYDPATDSWSRLPDYPAPMAHGACGAVDGTAVCAGGLTDDDGTATAETNTLDGDGWQARADLPAAIWGMAATAANDKLIISNGLVADNPTAQTLGYESADDTWSELPDAGQLAYRGSMSCGLVKAGGRYSLTVATAEILDGYTDCSA